MIIISLTENTFKTGMSWNNYFKDFLYFIFVKHLKIIYEYKYMIHELKKLNCFRYHQIFLFFHSLSTFSWLKLKFNANTISNILKFFAKCVKFWLTLKQHQNRKFSFIWLTRKKTKKNLMNFSIIIGKIYELS